MPAPHVRPAGPIAPAVLWAGLLAFSLLGCSGGGEGGGDRAGSDGSRDAPPTSEVDRLLADPDVEMLDPAEVRAAVQVWLSAQNEGDFEAYSALYATRFFGVKRSGPRTYRFERDGWLADRKRMFGKPMSVAADELEIATSRQTAQVRFVQTWASGRYEDVGPKQLILTREEGALRIAREEMLSSKLVRGGAAEEPGVGRFAFVAEAGGETWMRLAAEATDDQATGVPRLLSREPAVARRRAEPTRIPPELAGTSGRQVVLLGASGPVCRATLAELVVMTRFWPHFGMVQVWDGTLDPDLPRPTDGEIAEEVWSMGPKSLWARVQPGAGEDCAGATWAREAALPAPRVYRTDPVLASSLEPTVEPALRKLRGFGTIQAAYEREVAEPRPRWWDAHEAAAIEVAAFVDDVSGTTLVAAWVSSGFGCGGFYGEFWALWRVESGASGPKLSLLSDAAEPGALFRAETAVDLDGAGTIVFVGGSTLVEAVDPVWRPTAEATTPSFDCPC